MTQMTQMDDQETAKSIIDIKFDSILAAQDINYQQNEQLLIIGIQQQNLLNQVVQVINAQSQMLNDINQKLTSTVNKLADIEMNLSQSEDSTQTIQQDIQQGFELLNSNIDNIQQDLRELKVYGTIS